MMTDNILNLSAGRFSISSPVRWWTLRKHERTAHLFITGEVLPNADGLLSEIGDALDVQLYLDCRGGDATTALEIYESLKGRCSIAKIVHASSAAIVIALAADRRIIQADARMMAHSSRVVVFDTASGLRDAALRCEESDRKAFAIFCERTGQPADIVRHWLSGPDFWFNSEEALAVGLAHEIEIARAVAPVTSPASSEDPAGPTEDELFLFSLLQAAGRLHVRNRREFIRNLCVWASGNNSINETQ